MSEKLATLIGIQVVGLHQGQRKYAPRKQAGHMTAVDQIVRNVEKVLARGGRPHMALANKLARILWAMMKTGECFRTEMFAKA